jgi:hypothetical protein
MSNVRAKFGGSGGPPYGPFGLRVSTNRHGVTAMNARGGVKSVIVVRPPSAREAV